MCTNVVAHAVPFNALTFTHKDDINLIRFPSDVVAQVKDDESGDTLRVIRKMMLCTNVVAHGIPFNALTITLNDVVAHGIPLPLPLP